MAFWQWSRTPASNATADPTINWAEGMAPSAVDDSARAMMARLADFRDDISGLLATGGTSTAYTLATKQVLASVPSDGQLLAFTVHATNNGGATLTVDGGTTFPIASGVGVPIPAGTLVSGSPYTVKFSASNSVWLLRDLYVSANSVPLGTVLPYAGGTAPNSNFALAYGQAISRTTYAALLALIGTTYGSGDGSTTFNIPDLRGRLPVGQDNMGGSAANRVTSAGSGIDGATVGATGGAQNVTLDTTMIPAHAHASPALTDPGHNHSYTGPAANQAQSPGTKEAGTTPLTTGSNTTGITLAPNTGSAGGGAAHNNMPPSLVLPFIIRIF